MHEAKKPRAGDAKGGAEKERGPERTATRAAAPGSSAFAWRIGGLPLQRRCTCTGTGEPCARCAAEEQQSLQRFAAGPAPSGVPASVGRALGSGSGRPLDAATNAYFGRRFGRDFGDVRVQTDGTSAREAGALAYTVGPQIVFRDGAFAPGTSEGRRLLAHELAHVVQQESGAVALQRAGGGELDVLEAEAERAAAEAVAGQAVTRLTGLGSRAVQRSPDPAALLVGDDAAELEPGQMRKTTFLRLLHDAACSAVEQVISPAGYTTDDCAYLARWFAIYATREAAEIERAMRRYAPETENARTASEAIDVVVARARRAAERWIATGEVTGVPEDIDTASLAGGALAAAASAAGQLLFSARPGGAVAAEPGAVAAGLGAGHPLDGAVRSRMESTFARSFGDVRVHDDAAAASLSDRLNARAFTVGRDVAFAAGEFRPGTVVGDALIAHELAHVAQQSRRDGTAAPEGALEREADSAALDALAGRRVLTRLDGGLRLQRCSRRSAPSGPALPTPSATDYLISGRKDAPGDTMNIYFDRGSAVIDATEKAKIPAVITLTGPAAPLTLVGYRSEDEPAALATDRPKAVTTALKASVPTPYAATPTEQPEPGLGLGKITYRDYRKVEIQTPPSAGVVAPNVPACGTPNIPCGTSFSTAQPRAITLVDNAITALNAPLSVKATSALTDLFGGPVAGPASAAAVQANLTRLKTHIGNMSNPGRHQCHESACDAGCSSDAYNIGTGGTAVMTLCTGFVNEPGLDNRAYTLIHEGSHGTAGLAAVDISYETERRIRTLTNAEALRNTDSYTVLVRILNAPPGVVVPIGFAGDTRTGMSAAEDRAAATALAHTEKWLIQSWQDVGTAYAAVNTSVGQPAWVGSSSLRYDQETVHRLAGVFAGLTDPGTAAPFAIPVAGDREKLAAFYDRFEIMFRTMYGHGITMTKVGAGPDRWAAGPGRTVELSNAFFALPTAVAQIRRLIELLAAVTPGISPALVPQYVEAADRMRAHRGLGP